MTPSAVLKERRRMRRNGFVMRAGRPLWHVRDGRAHHIRVVPYQAEATTTLYVELWETHDRARRARIVPLSEVVHLLQNIGKVEFSTIAKRRKVQR